MSKLNREASLHDQAIVGGRWTMLSAIGGVLIQLLQLSVLGRLLHPSDFGLMAMIVVVISFINLFADLGLSNYLIQINYLSSRVFSSLFWVCIVNAFVLSGVVILISDWVAVYYKVPILANYLPILGGMILATAISQAFFSLLQRELRFRLIAIIDLISMLLGLIVSIILAFLNKGLWALIVGQLTNSWSKAIMCWFLCQSCIYVKLYFRWTDFTKAAQFGCFQIGERTLNFVSWNIDKFIIGRLLGENALGIYSVAYQLILRPFSVINPIFNRVAFPLFAKIQTDNRRLSHGYITVVRTIGLISFPIYIFIIIAAHSIIFILLGEKWIEAAPIVSILAGLGFVFSLGNPIGNLILAKKRPDLGFYFNLFSFVIYGLAFFIGSEFGLGGVAVSFLIAAIGVLFPSEFLLRWYLVGMVAHTYLFAIKHLLIGCLISLFLGAGLMFYLAPFYGYVGTDIGVGLVAVLAYFLYIWFAEYDLLCTTFRMIF